VTPPRLLRLSDYVRRPPPRDTASHALAEPAPDVERDPAASDSAKDASSEVTGLTALAEAYLRQRQALRSLLMRRVRNEQASQDLLNDMWLRIGRMADAEAPRDPAAYLRTIAGNLALDWLRRQTLRSTYAAPDAEADHVASPAPTAEQILHSKRVLEFLMAVIDELPTRRKEALLLYRVEGWTMAEVGRHMGISPRTVEVHVAKAIAYCAARLSEAGLMP
jgi:RNA polymerase sigma factor (sigma-70 family)